MTVHELAGVPDTQRDNQWENQFLKALSLGNIDLISENPVQGPDSWPYFLAVTKSTAKEPAQKILNWLSTRGMGLVLNPEKEHPDYVLSFGMIWSFRETGFFFKDTPTPAPGSTELDPGKILHAGTPTAEYLPDYVRKILREFFRDQGVLEAKILLISEDRVHYDLAFSIESLRNPPASELAGVAEAIGWFLPPHYSILLVSEKGLPPFSVL